MRSRLRRPPVLDVVVTAVLVVLGVAETVVPFPSRQGDGSVALTVSGVVLLTLPLLVRRRAPLPALVVVTIGWPLLWLAAPVYVLFYGQFVVMGVATYSVARWGRGRAPLYGAVLRAGTLILGNVVVPELRGPSEVAFDWGVSVLAFGAGLSLRAYQRRAAEHLRRAVETEVAAASRALAAVTEERARIARELHDIVAHSVSLMVVQAGAAEQVVDDDPAYVAGALATIRETGTGALGEMRRVVAVLRDSDDGSLSPLPGLDQVLGLTEEASRSGLAVSLEVTGERRPLPVGVELTAYRIVQEALTNVRRHAEATRACVRLGYDAESLRIEVADDGRGMPDAPAGPSADGGGHGLVGMRERATLYGGEVEAFSTEPAGFVVRATLPAT